MIIFQKKIIIGSIMSFIATAIGVIAVFFPDLLNLQKEKIDKLTLTINSVDDFNKFSQFLDKKVDDGKIFELDVTLCFAENGSNPDNYENNQFKMNFYNHGIWSNEEGITQCNFKESEEVYGTFEDEDGDGKLDIDGCVGKTYSFTGEHIHTGFWAEENSCKLKDSASIPRLKGFALFSKRMEDFPNPEIIEFKSLPPEQLKLRNY